MHVGLLQSYVNRVSRRLPSSITRELSSFTCSQSSKLKIGDYGLPYATFPIRGLSLQPIHTLTSQCQVTGTQRKAARKIRLPRYILRNRTSEVWYFGRGRRYKGVVWALEEIGLTRVVLSVRMVPFSLHLLTERLGSVSEYRCRTPFQFRST